MKNKAVRLLLLCAAAVLLLATAASADGIQQLALATNDLVYDPVTHLLYASALSGAGVLGNEIASIDPVSGRLGIAAYIGSEPNKLALSDDGQYLYVGLDGAASVRRFDTTLGLPGPVFPLGGDSLLGPYYVDDMAVQPGNPEVVAVSRRALGVALPYADIAIYDHGVPRNLTTVGRVGATVIAFSDSPGRLYGYDNEDYPYGFQRMTVDASGVNVDDTTEHLITGAGVDIRYDRGLIFTTTGLEFDPEALAVRGVFNGVGNNALVAPDVSAGRVYFLASDGTTTKLLTFDQQTSLQIGALTIPGVKGRPHSLVRWGRELAGGGGLAFATDQGQVFIITLNPPPSTAAPLDFSLTLSPSSATGYGAVTASLTFTAPIPAGGLRVDLSSSDPAEVFAPVALLMPAGALDAYFAVGMLAVPAPKDVVITARAGSLTHSATLHLNASPPPGAVAHLDILPNPVVGGMPALGELSLGQPVSGGLSIPLVSTNPAAAQVPAAVFLPAGAGTVTFPIVTFPVATPTTVTVGATVPDGPANPVPILPGGPGISIPVVSVGPVSLPLQVRPPAAPATPSVPPPTPGAGPPAAPTALSAQVLSPTRVQLFWRDNSDNETAFALWRRDATHDWARVGVVPPNTTTFTDASVMPGTAYTYRVRATNLYASDWSNEVTVVTPGGV